MKSRKRGPAPPVVCGSLATRPGRRPPAAALAFCSRRRSDLFTPPATRRAPRPPRARPSPGAVRWHPPPASAPARRRGHRLPGGPVGCSRLGETTLPFPGQPPTMIYWKDVPLAFSAATSKGALLKGGLASRGGECWHWVWDGSHVGRWTNHTFVNHSLRRIQLEAVFAAGTRS